MERTLFAQIWASDEKQRPVWVFKGLLLLPQPSPITGVSMGVRTQEDHWGPKSGIFSPVSCRHKEASSTTTVVHQHEGHYSFFGLSWVLRVPDHLRPQTTLITNKSLVIINKIFSPEKMIMYTHEIMSYCFRELWLRCKNSFFCESRVIFQLMEILFDFIVSFLWVKHILNRSPSSGIHIS